MKSLSSILFEIETEQFELRSWQFAVNSYFTNSCTFENNLNTYLNTQYQSDKYLTEMDIMFCFNDNIDIKHLVENVTEQVITNGSIKEGEITDAIKKLKDDTIDDIKTKSEILKLAVKEKWDIIIKWWKDKLEIFEKWATEAKLSIKEIITLLSKKEFYNAFKKSGALILSTLKKLLEIWSETVGNIQNTIFKPIKKSIAGKTLDEISHFLDIHLNEKKDKEWKTYVRMLLGLAIVAITYKIWCNMFFIGDWRYDFDYASAIETITGTVNFQDVLGADWIPTLTWLFAGIASKTLDLAVPCPPNCAWFGNWNVIAAGFVTAYLMATNNSLKRIKESDIGEKVQKWIKTVDFDMKDINTSSKYSKLLVNKGKLLKKI